jgi:hypothetical protein
MYEMRSYSSLLVPFYGYDMRVNERKNVTGLLFFKLYAFLCVH